MSSLTRHPRYPASGITWGQRDAAKLRVPRPRSSADGVEASSHVKQVRRSRPAPRPSWVAVEVILIMLGAILLDWYLLTS